jgi:hypothetical protein
MTTLKRHFLIPLIAAVIALYSASAFAQKFSPPSLAETTLNAESFVPMNTRRVKNATLLWVNHDYLREMKIAVPPTGLTPELTQEILDTWAFISPEGIPEEKLGSATKTFYADIYGGSGGDAEGSGRAAASPKIQGAAPGSIGSLAIQIKGIGRTPLASPKPKVTLGSTLTWNPKNFYLNLKSYFSEIHHSHGGATLREAIGEAAWGEILQRELPFGANRVIAVIATDLKIGATGEPRALIVRENSIRPAHFMINNTRYEKNSEAEQKRVQRLIVKHIKDLQKLASHPGTDTERFMNAQAELIQRIGQKYGTEFAHGFFHGSTSPSNIEFSGRALDHGPMTALDGYPKAMFADNVPFGSTREFETNLLFEYFEDLWRTSPKWAQPFVLNEEKISSILRTSFANQVSKEFLTIAGAPPKMAEALMEHPSAQEYAKLIRAVAEHGNNENISVRYRVPGNTGTYDIHAILPAMMKAGTNRTQLEAALTELVADADLRAKLIQGHLSFVNELTEVAAKERIGPEAILRYAQAASEGWNRKLTKLYRGPGQWIRVYWEIAKFKFSQMTSKNISGLVDSLIDTSFRMNRAKNSLMIVKDQITNRATGSRVERVFNPVSNSEEIVLTGLRSGTEAWFFGHRMDLHTLQYNRVELNGKNLNLSGSVTMDNGTVKIAFPSQAKVNLRDIAEIKSVGTTLFNARDPLAATTQETQTPRSDERSKEGQEKATWLPKPPSGIMTCPLLFGT